MRDQITTTSRQPPTTDDDDGTWRSRGYLPHYDQPGLVQMVTFGLADSVPTPVLEEWTYRLELEKRLRNPQLNVGREFRRRLQQYLDAGHGECHLRHPEIARMVENTFLHFDGERYRLLAWVIMPNHVHVLVEIFSGYPLCKIVHSWKSFSASQANRILGRKGAFWRREYYDRYIRNEAHMDNALGYIRSNPTMAGLINDPYKWRFSSEWEGYWDGWDAGRDAGAPR